MPVKSEPNGSAAYQSGHAHDTVEALSGAMDVLPEANDRYGTQTYWDERYVHEDSFDWFKTYADLSALFSRVIPSKRARICVLGCGNSTLSADMYDDGFEGLVNLDYSPVVIEKMSATHSGPRPRMTWVVGDVKRMPFDDASFDVAIDKGTMDALMCAKGDVWGPPPEVVEACAAEVDEVVRILRPGGTFVYVTFGQKHFRLPHLRRPGVWDVETHELGGGGILTYFVYVMRKRPPAGAHPTAMQNA